MIAADRPVQRPPEARLLAVDAFGQMQSLPRAQWTSLLEPADLVVANDAATLPASLHGLHLRSGRPVEVRLAGGASLAAQSARRFTAVLFGEGDHRQRTEDRPLPPALSPGDLLKLGAGAGPLYATVEALLGHPRLALLQFHGTVDAIWAGLARHGRPVQYSHVTEALKLWDVWTPVAGVPAAFEPPSAGFVLDWQGLQEISRRGARFATLTHAAGLSSTGDPALDSRLPLDEPYRLPKATVEAVEATRRSGGRIVAVGTTVVRALEHAASRAPARDALPEGEGLATQRIGPGTPLKVVDVLLSGTHESGTSHHELLRAFADARTLSRIDRALEGGGYRTHEFGDSVWLERSTAAAGGREASPMKRTASPSPATM